MTLTEFQQSAPALPGQTILVWELSLPPVLLQPKCSPCAPQSQQHSPGPAPCSCTWPRSSCSRRCIPTSASCSHTACSHSGPCTSTVREGRGIQWPGCSWNAPGPASCGISRTGTPPSCPLSHFAAISLHFVTSQNNFPPNIQNKIFPPTDPSSGSTG